LFVIAYNLGRVEQWAFTGGAGPFAVLVCGLVLTYGSARLFRSGGWLFRDHQSQHLFARIEIEDVQDAPTQRLGVSEPV
jgi:hypothetical protein